MLKKSSKRILTTALLATFMFSNASFILPSIANAKEVKTQNCSCAKSQVAKISPVLEKELKDSIAFVYGQDKVNEMYAKIVSIIENTKANRDKTLTAQDMQRSSDWYKDEVVYMFYGDQYGVKTKNGKQTFKGLIGMLDHLQDLGVTTIYVLPFMDSPMGDAGFDVRDPQSVRADLGGMKEFKAFAKEAKKRGFKIKADLILNHFSDQHKWFQDIKKGDLSKLDYFVYKDEMPEYKKYRDESIGIVVEYDEGNGVTSKRRLIFPDNCENNYRKVMINGEDYYFYHTFYPFQLDVNWNNPDVLYYMLETIGYWANIGVDIFRMDAIPYFIKKPGTNAENLPETHKIIKILSAYTQAVAPRSILQAEACQWPQDILPYFGKEHTVKLTEDKDLIRTNEVQIGYHFPYMPAIWASLLTGDSSHFWKAYKATPEIPDSAAWALFLRVHDELTLEMVDIETRKLIYNKLAPKGAEFRKGFGVSGRIANFLDNDPKKIGLAFSILLSQPGVPIIYYGDEIGAQNNWKYAKDFAKQREQMSNSKGEKLLSYFDSRDINRGPITKKALYSAEKGQGTFQSEVYGIVKTLIKTRKSNSIMTRGEFDKVKTNDESIFAYIREKDHKKVLVVNNLSDKAKNVEVNLFGVPDLSDAKDLITGKKVDMHKGWFGKTTFTVEPYEYLWIEL